MSMLKIHVQCSFSENAFCYYYKIQINFAKNRFDKLGPCRVVSLPAETNYADDNEIADIEFTSISSVY